MAHHCTFSSMSVSVQSWAAQNWTQDPKQPDSCRIKRNDLLPWPPGCYADTAQDVVSHTCHKGTLQTAVVLHQAFHLLFCRSILSSAVPQPVLLFGASPIHICEPHGQLAISTVFGSLTSPCLTTADVESMWECPRCEQCPLLLSCPQGWLLLPQRQLIFSWHFLSIKSTAWE